MTAIKFIDPVTAKLWLDNNEAVMIDVREPGEYKAAHIAEATLIPLATLRHDLLPELGNKKLIVHCMFGKRGGTACEILSMDDPALEVYNLEGGLTAWENAGLKVVRSG